MKSKWADEFYKMQYGSMSAIDASYYETQADEIMEQIGKPIDSLLELGSWDGSLACVISENVSRMTTVELVKKMAEAAQKNNPGNIDSVHGSFYDVQITDKFDAVIYIDGFGTGTDADQLKLLKNIKHWMNDGGCALIDIYQPEHWKKADGIEMRPDPSNNHDIIRRYSYDYERNIMMDTWWQADKKELGQTQYLRCYTPEEIDEMCRQAGLKVTAYFPNGAMDYVSMSYHENASLEECMSYRIKIMKQPETI